MTGAHSAAERSYRTSKVGQKPGGPHARGMVAKRSYPMSEARGGGREEQRHIQGAVAVWAQEGLEKLFHVQGHERQ